MKTLSRDGIQRMAGGISTSTSTSSGGGGGNAGISAGWVEANFLSKDFFNLLFEVHINTKVTVTDGLETTETNTAGILSPNDTIPEDVVEQDTPSEGYTTTTHVSITSIEAKSNFWSSLAISALGLNSSGGGGGGASTLGDLLDVQLTSPQNGQALIYNSSLGKWVNGNATAGTVTSVGMTVPTGFNIAGSPITSSGTLALTFASGYSLPTTAKQTNWDTVYNWYANNPLSGYATQQWVTDKGYLTSVAFSDLTSHPTTLSGYGITDAKIASGTITLGLNTMTPWTSSNHPTTLSGYGITDALSNATTFWGQTASNGVVSGNMTSVGSITMSSQLYMANGQSVQFKDSGGTYRNVLTLNAGNQLAIGYHIRQQGYLTELQGGSISFTVGTSGVSAMDISSVGRVWVKQGTQGLRIGDGLITWDSGNNALKVQRISSGSVVDGGLYATSFISALGANTSGGGGGSATSGLATSYTLPYTTNETYRYWHKLGTYQMNTEAMCLVIDLFTGNGYNGTANQNSWARIIIKKSNTTSGTSGAVGITCEQFGRQISDGKIMVRRHATAYNTGEVWVKCPWGYPKGAYSVQGNFTAWTHNNSTSGDSTTGPTHNQNDVGYYNNTSTMTTGE